MSIPTLRRHFTFGHLNLQIDTVTNTEALLDELIARGADDPEYQDEVMPYWADLWHSALGLGKYLTAHEDKVKGKQVIELGCGLGLPGIVANCLGGKVTLTDYVQPALDFSRRNLELNQPNHSARFKLLDWRNPPVDIQYDLVLAADVAYERRFFQPLYDCIRTILKPGGECWLTEPGRQIAKDFLAGFPDQGFEVMGEEFMDITLDGTERKVRLIRIGKG